MCVQNRVFATTLRNNLGKADDLSISVLNIVERQGWGTVDVVASEREGCRQASFGDD